MVLALRFSGCRVCMPYACRVSGDIGDLVAAWCLGKPQSPGLRCENLRGRGRSAKSYVLLFCWCCRPRLQVDAEVRCWMPGRRAPAFAVKILEAAAVLQRVTFCCSAGAAVLGFRWTQK